MRPHLRARLISSGFAWRLVAFGCAVAAILGYLAWHHLALSNAKIAMAPERHAVAGWRACNRNARSGVKSTFRPLSDTEAAALVTHQPETRSYNSKPFSLAGHVHRAPNYDEPTEAQLQRFHRARTSTGQPITRFNPYLAYVDGRDGLRKPSTDDLIQWAAQKWGIPEDWLRAAFVQESFWNQYQLGDEASVSSRAYSEYPVQSRVSGSTSVYMSMGITQVKWAPNGAVGAGTEPLRWESTAFNVDYQAAMVRFYYDNPSGARSAWGDKSYAPCEAWNSIGGWFNPYPWGNSGQEKYTGQIRHNLADRAWLMSDFVHWTPSSLPPGVTVR